MSTPDVPSPVVGRPGSDAPGVPVPPGAETSGQAGEAVLPPLPRNGFLIAWVVFWILMVTVAIQDHLRSGRTDIWQPFLWETTSCFTASVIVWTQWRQIARNDSHLGAPWRWFANIIVRLPVIALVFVIVTYALRHGLYALAGESYRHESWGSVFVYETLKFAIFYLLFVAVIFGIRSHSAMNAQRMRAERARTLMQQAQLLQLTQQIEPHFLFNALNTIADTIHTDPALADTLLTRLARLLRAATDLASHPETTLGNELELLEGYASIMQARFGDRVTLTLQIDPASRACRVPSLVLQPLLENAYRHGVERSSRPCTIVVRTHLDGSALTLSVQDDAGPVQGPVQLGTGLRNLQQRLLVRYGNAARLVVEGGPAGGVLASIELPCEP